MKHSLTITFCLIAVIALSACTPQMIVGDLMSVIVTDKTIDDHIVSYASNKDCSTVRTELGMTYCKEDALKQTGPKMHCYNELGKVTCYKQPEIDTARNQVEDKTDKIQTWR